MEAQSAERLDTPHRELRTLRMALKKKYGRRRLIRVADVEEMIFRLFYPTRTLDFTSADDVIE